MGRFLRNGPQLWASLAFLLAFGLSGVARAQVPHDVPGGAPTDATWLGFVVALLWFMTSLVNGLRGNRERAAAAGHAPTLVEVGGIVDKKLSEVRREVDDKLGELRDQILAFIADRDARLERDRVAMFEEMFARHEKREDERITAAVRAALKASVQ